LWDFCVKTIAENQKRGAIFAPQKSPNPIVFEKVSCGAVIIHFARTYFEKNFTD